MSAPLRSSLFDSFPQLKASGDLSIPDRDAIIASLDANVRRFARSEPLAREHDAGDVVLIVLKGFLSVSKSLPDGRRQIVDILLGGDVLHLASGDGSLSALQVEALCETSVSRLAPAAWSALLRDCPPLAAFAERIEAAQRARMAERALRLGKGGARMRLAYALLELWIRARAIGLARGGAFHIPLTQQDLGDFAGLSSVHVCRTLGRLEEEGVISVEDHMDIRIRDAAALAQIAEVDPCLLQREITPFAP